MFGGPMYMPPPKSEQEIKEEEAEAMFTIQRVVAAAVMLYLSPFAIDAITKVF